MQKAIEGQRMGMKVRMGLWSGIVLAGVLGAGLAASAQGYGPPQRHDDDQGQWSDRTLDEYGRHAPRREYGLDSGGRQFGAVLPQDMQMHPGDQMESNNGMYQFEFQTDGNLVLTRADGAVLWASGTEGRRGFRLQLQEDGNMVLYGRRGAVWSTNTNGRASGRGLYLRLQDDGNLVLSFRRQPLWSTQTQGR